MRKEIMEFVQGCAECQRHKINNRPTKAPLQPIYPKPEALPFDTIALDYITKLPESQGSDSILTITDHDCTKAAVFIPCREEISAEETAALYLKHVFLRYGLPSKIISDRDPRFASKFTRELCKTLGITQNISTAYHPSTDGQSERSNQWLEQYLRRYVNERQDNWAHYLPLAEFTHNKWHSKTTRESPYYLLMGYNPHADWADRPSPIPQVTIRLQQFKEARKRAQELMVNAQKGWIKHRDTPKYQTGDLVWLEGHHLRTNQPTAKLAPKRHGPFRIIQVMSPVNYRLELPTQWSIHPVFHIDLLTPYRETQMHGENYSRPPPELEEGEEEYEVEKILDHRKFGRGRKLQYLIKWKGYPDSENQWVDQHDVFAEEAVAEYEALRSGPKTYIRSIRTTESLIPSTQLNYMSQSLSPAATPFIIRNNAGLRATSPISVRSTVEASSSDVSALSVYIQSRESLSTEPSILHPESIADTDSVVLTHPPGYTVTRANTPAGGAAYKEHENTRAPHPHLIYDVRRTQTSYATPALSYTHGNTPYQPI